MKAVIPVAGAGTRLRPHTYTQPKPLIPVAGKPIISYVIEQMAKAGVSEFVFIIGHLGEKIQEYVEQTYPKLSKKFVVQQDRAGTGHAIWTARKELKNTKDIFIVLGDTIYDVNWESFLNNGDSCLGVKRVDDPRLFGVAEFKEDGKVLRVVEKPRIPKSNMALVGLYKINDAPLLLDCLDFNISHDIRTFNEFQLTDGLMKMIEQGAAFRALPVHNWFDCGKTQVLLETNALFLKEKDYAEEDIPEFDNTIIVHPVSIGDNCKISNSIIGPNVTIGDHTTLNFAIVRDSIIGTYSRIEEIVMQHSVVGSDTAIKGLRQSLNIGDNTEIDFN